MLIDFQNSEGLGIEKMKNKKQHFVRSRLREMSEEELVAEYAIELAKKKKTITFRICEEILLLEHFKKIGDIYDKYPEHFI